MRDEQERTGLQYQLHAQGVAEAVDQQQAASRDAIHCQEVLDKTEDTNARRHHEGMVKLSRLKALHHNLIARSFQRAGHEPSYADLNRENRVIDGDAQIATRGTASSVESSPEISLTEKYRQRALIEYHAHDARADAFSLLDDRYRQLGHEDRACTYHERARLERASARGFDTAVKAYDKKLEELGNREHTQPEISDFRGSFRSLKNAQQHLEDYNNGHARVWNYARRVLENDRTIQRLEAACTGRPQSVVEHKLLKDAVDRGEKLKQAAETEAFNAVASYKKFQNEIQSAEKAYDALSCVLTGNPAQLTNTSPGNGTPPIKESQADRPGAQVGGSELTRLASSAHRQSRVVAAVLISQTLKEMDREL